MNSIEFLIVQIKPTLMNNASGYDSWMLKKTRPAPKSKFWVFRLLVSYSSDEKPTLLVKSYHDFNEWPFEILDDISKMKIVKCGTLENMIFSENKKGASNEQP